MKNLISIASANSRGSGIVFPCEYKDLEDGAKAYIVLTNRHVVEEVVDDAPENKDLRTEIDIVMYDIAGNKVQDDLIKHIYCAICQENINNIDIENEVITYDGQAKEDGKKKYNDYINDIAALLLIVNETVVISTSKVLFENISSKQIYSKGYPAVFKNDSINRILSIEGQLEEAADTQMGIYRIIDDYHWYAKTSDHDLFEGMSGGPVYINNNHEKKLIGMNQSLCNIGDGKNPFKFVYFIPIREIFEVLRKNEIVIFEQIDDAITIQWSCPEQKERLDVMVIGNSGAGKSSFIKSFCRNGKLLNSADDGQTTRMTIKYNVSAFCEKPYIKIQFKNKKEFWENIKEKLDLELVKFIFCYRFGLEPLNVTKDKKAYFIYIYQMLEGMDFGDDYKKKLHSLGNIIRELLYEIDVEEITDDKAIKCYSSIFDFFENLERARDFSKEQIKEYFNHKKYIQYCKKKGRESDKNQKKEYFTLIKMNKYTQVEEISKIKIDFFDLLNHFDGFFDLKELYFINDKFEQDIKEFQEDIFCRNGDLILNWRSLERAEDNDKQEQDTIDLEKHSVSSNELQVTENVVPQKEKLTRYAQIKEYYEKIYSKANEYIQEIATEHSYYKKEFNEMESKDIEFIVRCIKAEKDESLTSLVKEVSIEDAFSDEYAYWLYNKGIETINFYDTRGLDHVDIGNEVENYIGGIFSNLADKGQKHFDAIFYIKKMDSGKPTELENILPMIYKIQPAVPIYGIFTGADLFFKGKEDYLYGFRWNRENYKNRNDIPLKMFPKAVCKMYESDDIVNSIDGAKELKDKIYRMIVDNIVPFSTENNNKYFLSLNRQSIEQIFTSVLIDEWNGGFISICDLEHVQSDKVIELRKAIEKDVKKMFYNASSYNWGHRHHKTVEANFRRVFRKDDKEYNQNNPELGYTRTFIDRWSWYLQRGYQKAFLTEESETAEILYLLGINKSKVSSLLGNVMNRALLTGMNEWKKRDDENEFRKIFREMYQKSYGIYERDLFQYADKEYVDKSLSYQRIRALNDVCDFYKAIDVDDEKNYLNKALILGKYVDYFYNEIKLVLENENKRCMELLMKYDSQFGKQVHATMTFLDNYIKKDEKRIGGEEVEAEKYKKSINELLSIIIQTWRE
ncbi:hypothetical protein KPL47_02245 [Clostridium estertheticum]|uniref:hypothetical protein n=1 Tax=Clostridium estertheticum TaxID=238834 RepID=UPI001C0B1DE4|nr:hypothetical protein [Clostridium estertheticum]MBU3175184.1 hypothetical protein [Clostridium estertheticum]